MIEILRGLLKVFHRVGRFGCDRFDYFEHLRRGITQIGSTFSSKRLAVFCAAGGFGPLGKVNGHVAEQSKLHQPRHCVPINFRILVDLHFHAHFESRFARAGRWAGTRVRFGRMNCGVRFLCLFFFLRRHG